MNISILCNRCGGSFMVNTNHLTSLGITDIPKKCPTCLDRIQGRPAEKIIVSRNCEQEFGAVKIAIPDHWFEKFTAQANDLPCRRAIVKGDKGHGVSWSGRIDIYDFRPTASEVGHIRLMTATHEKGQLRVEKHGTVMGKKLEKVVRYPSVYSYLAIDPCETKTPTSALVFASVYYKSTLKGLGRQYGASLRSEALWSIRLSSASRSGRFGNEMMVGVVNNDNPIYGVGTGDVKFEKCWDLTHPVGS